VVIVIETVCKADLGARRNEPAEALAIETAGADLGVVIEGDSVEEIETDHQCDDVLLHVVVLRGAEEVGLVEDHAALGVHLQGGGRRDAPGLQGEVVQGARGHLNVKHLLEDAEVEDIRAPHLRLLRQVK